MKHPFVGAIWILGCGWCCASGSSGSFTRLRWIFSWWWVGVVMAAQTCGLFFAIFRCISDTQALMCRWQQRGNGRPAIVRLHSGMGTNDFKCNFEFNKFNNVWPPWSHWVARKPLHNCPEGSGLAPPHSIRYLLSTIITNVRRENQRKLLMPTCSAPSK